jgi:hypothetical protein
VVFCPIAYIGFNIWLATSYFVTLCTTRSASIFVHCGVKILRFSSNLKFSNGNENLKPLTTQRQQKTKNILSIDVLNVAKALQNLIEN